jgi:hypothetical protein
MSDTLISLCTELREYLSKSKAPSRILGSLDKIVIFSLASEKVNDEMIKGLVAARDGYKTELEEVQCLVSRLYDNLDILNDSNNQLIDENERLKRRMQKLVTTLLTLQNQK